MDAREFDYQVRRIAQWRAPSSPPCGCTSNCKHGYTSGGRHVADPNMDAGEWEWLTPLREGYGWDNRIRYGTRIGPVTEGVNQYGHPAWRWATLCLGDWAPSVDGVPTVYNGGLARSAPEWMRIRDHLAGLGFVRVVPGYVPWCARCHGAHHGETPCGHCHQYCCGCACASR